MCPFFLVCLFQVFFFFFLDLTFSLTEVSASLWCLQSLRISLLLFWQNSILFYIWALMPEILTTPSYILFVRPLRFLFESLNFLFSDFLSVLVFFVDLFSTFRAWNIFFILLTVYVFIEFFKGYLIESILLQGFFIFLKAILRPFYCASAML